MEILNTTRLDHSPSLAVPGLLDQFPSIERERRLRQGQCEAIELLSLPRHDHAGQRVPGDGDGLISSRLLIYPIHPSKTTPMACERFLANSS